MLTRRKSTPEGESTADPVAIHCRIRGFGILGTWSID